MGFVQIALALLWKMNQRGLFSRSGTLAARTDDSSLDSVMVVDVERNRKMNELSGKNQGGRRKEGAQMTPRFQGWIDDVLSQKLGIQKEDWLWVGLEHA